MIRASWWAVLRHVFTLIEAGKPVSIANLAKQSGRTRQAVWLLFKRNLELWEWLDEQQRTKASRRWGNIHDRMAALAEQGSVQAADQFCKMQANVYAAKGALPFGMELPDGLLPSNGVQINVLIPRPEMAQPGILPPPVRAAIPAPAKVSIPTVSVR